MSQRWRKAKIAPDDLPLVVLWSEMLAATGMPDSRAFQLVQERRFPIRQLPYHGYKGKGRKRHIGRNQIDVRDITFAKAEVVRFIALDEYERNQKTLMEWELPRCCHCPFHCPPAGQAHHEHPYASRFKRRWWNQ
jgi:hypothetical protein